MYICIVKLLGYGDIVFIYRRSCNYSCYCFDCCKECNQYKANRTPKEAGMKLLRRPFRPDDYMEFEFLKYPSDIELYSDSAYLINTFGSDSLSIVAPKKEKSFCSSFFIQLQES